MARKSSKKSTDNNGASMIPIDQQCTEDGVVLEIVEPTETKIETPKEMMRRLIDEGHSTAAASKASGVQYQLVRAYALKVGKHTTGKGEVKQKAPKVIKLTLTPEQATELRELLQDLDDEMLHSLLKQLPSEK